MSHTAVALCVVFGRFTRLTYLQDYLITTEKVSREVDLLHGVDKLLKIFIVSIYYARI